MPKRIQRKRTKGWKMPENTVYVGRGSKWGNPFVVSKTKEGKYRIFRLLVRPFDSKIEAVKYSVENYRDRVARHFPESWTKELKGKNLACWCRLGQACHADVLLEIVNNEKSS